MEILKLIKNTTSHLPLHQDVLGFRQRESDDIAAIEFSCQRLSLDLKKDLFNHDHYLNYFFSVDEKTRILVEKVTQSYIGIDIINHQHKARIASACFMHHRLMFSIYFKLIVALAPEKHPQLGLLIARAIDNAAEIIKWRYYNHQNAPGNVWLQLCSLFDMAEKNGLVYEKINIYPDLADAELMPNSIATAFISINMLGSLDNAGFRPAQIDFLSKILAKWTTDLEIDKEYNEKKHLFSVDLAKNCPAKRIRNFHNSITNRYWCMDSINVKLQILMHCIETSRPPKQKAMRTLANHLFAYPTLQAVKSEWSLSEYKRQRRESPRIKTDKPATDAYGFEDTYYQIKHFEDSLVEVKKKSFAEDLGELSHLDEDEDSASIASGQLRKYVESMTAFMDANKGYCHIVDESAKGICIHTTKQSHELTVGMMLGVATKNQKFGTKIGIIRSIKPAQDNMLRIGVEIISRTAFCVEATHAKQAYNKPIYGYTVEFIEENTETNDLEFHNLNEISDTFDCLLLPKEFSFNKEESMILPKNQHNKNQQFQLKLGNKERLVMLTETLEQHDNWVRSYFADVGNDVKN